MRYSQFTTIPFHIVIGLRINPSLSIRKENRRKTKFYFLVVIYISGALIG